MLHTISHEEIMKCLGNTEMKMGKYRLINSMIGKNSMIICNHPQGICILKQDHGEMSINMITIDIFVIELP